MTIVVDTSVLIDHLRGVEDARTALRGAVDAGERLTTSVLTKVEILAGMRESEQAATGRLLATLDWIAVDEELAESAGLLANRYLRSHPGVDPVDYVIAATVTQLAAKLWTRNVKHFPMFPDLKPPY
ncbi:MAG TPA: type II toxin-antitoxin system VapC family toxin [Jiangellaceae bacterium]|nr:type II toxin-antitoxin system VapC family toxin [Jiangellaceae bacterium]